MAKLENIAEEYRDGSTVIESWAVDLNLDGNKEYVVIARGSVCGASNCPMWVIGTKGRSYTVLLDAFVVQDLQVLPQKTNGYNNILTFMHGSAFDHAEKTYAFDGRRYRRIQCQEVEFMFKDKDGEIREHAKPRITGCG